MSNVTPIIGHIFIIRTRGEMRVDGSIEKMTILLQAAQQEELQQKVRYMLDLSRYSSFSITHIEKVRPKFHVLKSNLIPKEDVQSLRSSVEMPSAATGSAEAQRTNQPSSSPGARLFAFGVAGKLVADCEEHAMRKVGKWLLSLGLDKEWGSPLMGGGKLIVEEEGPVDSTVTSQSQLNRMDATHFREQKPVSGGLPSLGKR